jgi:hypothetical protein
MNGGGCSNAAELERERRRRKKDRAESTEKMGGMSKVVFRLTLLGAIQGKKGKGKGR